MTATAPDFSYGPEDSVTDLFGSLLGWSPVTTRVMTLLATHRIERAGQLTALTEEDLRKWRGIGDGSITEVKRVLGAHGMTLTSPRR